MGTLNIVEVGTGPYICGRLGRGRVPAAADDGRPRPESRALANSQPQGRRRVCEKTSRNHVATCRLEIVLYTCCLTQLVCFDIWSSNVKEAVEMTLDFHGATVSQSLHVRNSRWKARSLTESQEGASGKGTFPPYFSGTSPGTSVVTH